MGEDTETIGEEEDTLNRLRKMAIYDRRHCTFIERRGKLEIVADILLAVADKCGATKTRIGQQAELNYTRCSMYLNFMERTAHYIRNIDGVYSITKKGSEYLRKYKELMDCFGYYEEIERGVFRKKES